MTNKQQELDNEAKFTELDEGALEEVSGGGNTRPAIRGAYLWAKDGYKETSRESGHRAALKNIVSDARTGWRMGRNGYFPSK